MAEIVRNKFFIGVFIFFVILVFVGGMLTRDIQYSNNTSSETTLSNM